jgi:hypothetical protein
MLLGLLRRYGWLELGLLLLERMQLQRVLVRGS